MRSGMRSRSEGARVLVTVEQKFIRTPNGSIWSAASFTSSFWSRYLAAFDSALIAARVASMPEPPPGAHVISSERIAFLALAPYSGVGGFVRHAGGIQSALESALRPDDAVILRVPSAIAGRLMPALIHTGHPYAVEVVGDGYDILKQGTYRHTLRPVLQHVLARSQRSQCRHAAAAAYVTRDALQSIYPCGQRSGEPAPFTTHYSSIELGADAFAEPVVRPAGARRLRLVTIATLARLYKAPDLMIRAVAQCRGEGLDLDLTIVGDGRHRVELEQLAAALGITGYVEFVGVVPNPEAARVYLDRSDLFVLPSRSEGLPRAMIEAMARGLPCIGSRVGGIPELLADEDLVDAGSVSQLAAKIGEMFASTERRSAAVTRNQETARAYGAEVLRNRRAAFYREVRRLTDAWLGRGSAAERAVA